MSESSLSVRLWKPDNPLMESTGGYCCLYPPPSPSSTYEDLLKERAKQQGPALTWQATMATGKEAGRREAGGRHTRGWWELLWPACRGHSTQVLAPWLSGFCVGQIFKGLLFFHSNKGLTTNRKRKTSVLMWKVALNSAECFYADLLKISINCCYCSIKNKWNSYISGWEEKYHF